MNQSSLNIVELLLISLNEVLVLPTIKLGLF